jgi:serine phosphatase RsbU (regulator of sigma subunit)
MEKSFGNYWNDEVQPRQQKELTDSIYYASFIQSALLPTREEWSRILPESFIYYNPKDIVSGDFYWIRKNRNIITIVVADCTGHGVPGAFMSILGISFLNEIYTKGNIPTAKSILNQLREKVMKALRQTGNAAEPKDGMDVALCMIDIQAHTLQFSGANNPVYIMRGQELIQIRGDAMPIGIAPEIETSFVNQTLELQPTDTIYLFTDGYPDQFGGEEGKKFKYPNFRTLLQKIQKYPLPQQGQKVATVLENWKGKHRQVDDILVIGFKCPWK